MLSALLRILYAMNVSRNLTVPTMEVVEKNHARLIEVIIPSEDLLPELMLEVVCMFPISISTGFNEPTFGSFGHSFLTSLWGLCRVAKKSLATFWTFSKEIFKLKKPGGQGKDIG